MAVSSVAILLASLDEAYDRKAWHGPNLKGSLRRLSEAEASWRPSPRRHNVWEIVVHAAYWKYATRRRLTGGKRVGFAVKGSNWFRRPDGERTFREDVRLLDDAHRRLREAVAGLSAASLARRPSGSQHSTARLVYGMAAHDAYHTGQIRLIETLYKSRDKFDFHKESRR